MKTPFSAGLNDFYKWILSALIATINLIALNGTLVWRIEKQGHAYVYFGKGDSVFQGLRFRQSWAKMLCEKCLIEGPGEA